MALSGSGYPLPCALYCSASIKSFLFFTQNERASIEAIEGSITKLVDLLLEYIFLILDIPDSCIFYISKKLISLFSTWPPPWPNPGSSPEYITAYIWNQLS